MSDIYFGEWEYMEDMLRDFDITEETLGGLEVLFATYEQEPYEGMAFVFLKGKDGRCYIVEASHCSEYGLEGTWRPTETIPEVIKRQLKYSFLSYSPGGKARLIEILSGMHVH